MELTRENIVALLESNDLAIGRALMVLNDNQTADEKQTVGTVIHANGKGFTPVDAAMGVSMAKQFAQRGSLSLKQLEYWRKPNAKGVMRISKYWRQLIDAAKAKKEAAQ